MPATEKLERGASTEWPFMEKIPDGKRPARFGYDPVTGEVLKPILDESHVAKVLFMLEASDLR